jgi:hypothetical protein
MGYNGTILVFLYCEEFECILSPISIASLYYLATFRYPMLESRNTLQLIVRLIFEVGVCNTHVTDDICY